MKGTLQTKLKSIPVNKSLLNKSGQGCLIFPNKQAQEEAQAALEDEQRAKEVCRDHLIASERKAHTTQNALEEARTLLEQADRARRIIEQELSDTNESLSELTCQNQAIAGAKRKLEAELETIHVSNQNLFLIKGVLM